MLPRPPRSLLQQQLVSTCVGFGYFGERFCLKRVSQLGEKKIMEVILEWSGDLVRLFNMTPSVLDDFSSYHPGFKVCAGAV